MGIVNRIVNKGKELMQKAAVKMAAAAAAVTATVTALAPAAHAENADLETATGMLTDGIGDMSVQALVVIGVILGLIIMVVGIFFLIRLSKRGVSQAS
jgi:hypothetical protein